LHDYSFGLDDEASCFPTFRRISRDEPPSLKIVDGRHPIVVATNPDMAFIPNSFELDERLAILTGANMGMTTANRSTG
jgi:DNA mismatch repair ATPase MutS